MTSRNKLEYFHLGLCLGGLRLNESCIRDKSSNGAARCARIGYTEKISCDFKEQVIFSVERES